MDLFAVPVSLTYKGKKSFSTLCGGCFSLVLIVGFLIYAGLSLHTMIAYPVLKANSEKNFISLPSNTEAYHITALDSTMAFSISSDTTD